MPVLKYEIPLTKISGKVRIKERLAFSDYGLPIAPTKTILSPKHYIEWQIGYDNIVDSSEHFIGANGKKKQIYELSEFLLFGLKNFLIFINSGTTLPLNSRNSPINYKIKYPAIMQVAIVPGIPNNSTKLTIVSPPHPLHYSTESVGIIYVATLLFASHFFFASTRPLSTHFSRVLTGISFEIEGSFP